MFIQSYTGAGAKETGPSDPAKIPVSLRVPGHNSPGETGKLSASQDSEREEAHFLPVSTASSH